MRILCVCVCVYVCVWANDKFTSIALWIFFSVEKKNESYVLHSLHWKFNDWIRMHKHIEWIRIYNEFWRWSIPKPFIWNWVFFVCNFQPNSVFINFLCRLTLFTFAYIAIICLFFVIVAFLPHINCLKQLILKTNGLIDDTKAVRIQ